MNRSTCSFGSIIILLLLVISLENLLCNTHLVFGCFTLSEIFSSDTLSISVHLFDTHVASQSVVGPLFLELPNFSARFCNRARKASDMKEIKIVMIGMAKRE
jgi:hypothetical protein